LKKNYPSIDDVYLNSKAEEAWNAAKEKIEKKKEEDKKKKE